MAKKVQKTKFQKFIEFTGKASDWIVHFNHNKPFEVLGLHYFEDTKQAVINCYIPEAKSVTVIPSEKNLTQKKMKAIGEGFFQIVYNSIKDVFKYKLDVKYLDNNEYTFYDPYQFPVILSDFDLYLLAEGNHFKSYEKYGAKLKTINRINGVQFLVWAPNAKAVSIVGNFNYWRAGAYPMENINETGNWGLFIPGIKEGEIYKYAIKSKDKNYVYKKSDPYGFQSEVRPDTASVVRNIEGYEWKDSKWIARREKWNFIDSPISVYELHLGSWKKDYDNKDFRNDWGYKNYKQLAYEVTDYVKEMGYTHVELLPVMEHPLDQSWGYQVSNYYAPTSRYGTPQDFMFFVDYLHQNDIGVILDWVPAHFPTDEHGLAEFDSTQLYAYKNPKKGYHMDWGTYRFDYGRTEVVNFLISNALFWLDKYHADGLRVDAVASMIYLDYSRKEGEWEPNVHGGRENLEAIEFIKKLNVIVHEQYKGIMMIAEESTAYPKVSHPVYAGGLGFDMKWNMGWMNDMLNFFSLDPVYRKHHQEKLTFSLWYAFNENFILPVSHDEVVHGKKSLLEKMPGDDWHRFANLRAFFVLMFSHPGKKLNFMGNEIAQYHEWNSDKELDWFVLQYEKHLDLNSFFRELNTVYNENPALYEADFNNEGFEWIDFSDANNSVICFMRKSKNKKNILVIALNLTPVVRQNYVFGVPYEGYYKEILNSDAREFGGKGFGNLGGVHSINESKHSKANTIKLNLPPLAGIILRYEGL
jgi:1,4-alpha-glucan branching enzyme